MSTFSKDLGIDNHKWKVEVAINILLNNSKSSVPDGISKLYSSEIDEKGENELLDQLFERKKSLGMLLKHTTSRRKELMLKTYYLLVEITEDNETALRSILAYNEVLENKVDITTQSSLENHFVELLLAVDRSISTIVEVTTANEIDRPHFVNCFSGPMHLNKVGLSYSDYVTINMFRELKSLSRERIELLTDIFMLKKEVYKLADGFLNKFSVQVINNVYGKNIATKKLQTMENFIYKEKLVKTGNCIKNFLTVSQFLPIPYEKLKSLTEEHNNKVIIDKLTSYKEKLISLKQEIIELKSLYIED